MKWWRVVAVRLTSDHISNSTTPVGASGLLLSGQSLTLAIVYVTLTMAGLVLVVFLLPQLDVIFTRRLSVGVVQSLTLLLACCTHRPLVRSGKIQEQTRSLLTSIPLIVYTGVLDAFVSCEFTQVCVCIPRLSGTQRIRISYFWKILRYKSIHVLFF